MNPSGTVGTRGAVSPGGGLRIVPAPDTRPPVVSADEAYGRRATPFLQDALAIDFGEPDEPSYVRRRETLPDPEPFVARLAQAFVEVFAGIRAPQQVVRWTTPAVYDVLSRRAFVAARRPRTVHRPAVVRTVRIQEPTSGVIEACAVVVHHDRVSALALRLAGLDRRWVVTELSVG